SHTRRWNGVPPASSGMASSACRSPAKYAASRPHTPAESRGRSSSAPKRCVSTAWRWGQRSRNSIEHRAPSRVVSMILPMGDGNSASSSVILPPVPVEPARVVIRSPGAASDRMDAEEPLRCAPRQHERSGGAKAYRKIARAAAYRAAHQDLAAQRPPGDARRDVDVVSDEVAVARASRSVVDPDAQGDAAGGALPLERGPQRPCGRGEAGHHPVAEALQDATGVAADGGQHGDVVLSYQAERRPVTTLGDARREAGDVGEEHREASAAGQPDGKERRQPLDAGDGIDQGIHQPSPSDPTTPDDGET